MVKCRCLTLKWLILKRIDPKDPAKPIRSTQRLKAMSEKCILTTKQKKSLIIYGINSRWGFINKLEKIASTSTTQIDQQLGEKPSKTKLIILGLGNLEVEKWWLMFKWYPAMLGSLHFELYWRNYLIITLKCHKITRRKN